MNRGYIKLILIAVVLIGGAWLVLQKDKPARANLDELAQCLTGQGVIMYGADWCPHCQNEKKAFGDSFRHINYVECPDEPDRCLAAGVSAFPTWVFPDGKKLEGEQGPDRLAQESGCGL
ncbi:MAG: hypothetical protein WD898_02135 [Candidatus Paceibacterota bacterium]